MKQKIYVTKKWVEDLINVANEANIQYGKRRKIEDMKEFDSIIHLISYAQSSEYLLSYKQKSYK